MQNSKSRRTFLYKIVMLVWPSKAQGVYISLVLGLIVEEDHENQNTYRPFICNDLITFCAAQKLLFVVDKDLEVVMEFHHDRTSEAAQHRGFAPVSYPVRHLNPIVVREQTDLTDCYSNVVAGLDNRYLDARVILCPQITRQNPICRRHEL